MTTVSKVQHPAAPSGKAMQLQTRRFSFQSRNPECRKASVSGWLLDRMDLMMGEGNDRQERTAYVIRLTHPCFAVDQQDKVHEVPAGQEVLVWGTWQLDKELSHVAVMPNDVAWVSLIADKELPHPKKKGHTIWDFSIQVDTTFKRRQGFCLPPGRANTPQIPAGAGGARNGAGPTADENDAGEVPFA